LSYLQAGPLALLATRDFVSIHLALGGHTRDLLAPAELALLKWMTAPVLSSGLVAVGAR
jgi:lactate dehydrogenase-like 2-hydroxyacid dehydrogenase